MRKFAAKLRARLTWKNARWCVRVNVVGWLIQGAIVGLLTVVGVEAFAAMVSAKVASWTVFIFQLIAAGRSN